MNCYHTMSQPDILKPLQTLQNMISAVLVETGKSLRALSRDGARSLAISNTRPSGTLPNAIENFHQALDDLETEILLSKASLAQDLDDRKAMRTNLDNSIPNIKEETINQKETFEVLNFPGTTETEFKSGLETTVNKELQGNQLGITQNLTAQVSEQTKFTSLDNHYVQKDTSSLAIDLTISRNPTPDSSFDLPVDRNVETVSSSINSEFSLKPDYNISPNLMSNLSQDHKSNSKIFLSEHTSHDGNNWTDLNITPGPATSVINNQRLDIPETSSTDDGAFNNMFFGEEENGLTRGGQISDLTISN